MQPPLSLKQFEIWHDKASNPVNPRPGLPVTNKPGNRVGPQYRVLPQSATTTTLPTCLPPSVFRPPRCPSPPGWMPLKPFGTAASVAAFTARSCMLSLSDSGMSWCAYGVGRLDRAPGFGVVSSKTREREAVSSRAPRPCQSEDAIDVDAGHIGIEGRREYACSITIVV